VKLHNAQNQKDRMDEDISDILASVSAPPIPQATLDLQAITRAWVNERTSPRLLPYPVELVERVMERVKKQVSRVDVDVSCLQSGWEC